MTREEWVAAIIGKLDAFVAEVKKALAQIPDNPPPPPPPPSLNDLEEVYKEPFGITRSTTALYRWKDGTIMLAPENVGRINYD